MSEKHKKVCKSLIFFEYFFINTTAISGCVSISAFATLVGVPEGNASSGVGIKICGGTAEITRY